MSVHRQALSDDGKGLGAHADGESAGKMKPQSIRPARRTVGVSGRPGCVRRRRQRRPSKPIEGRFERRLTRLARDGCARRPFREVRANDVDGSSR